MLDGAGDCCESGNVDACEVCDGAGVGPDALGVCCEAPNALTGSMVCCQEEIDGCVARLCLLGCQQREID